MTKTDPTKIRLHRDGTVTYWSVYEQCWRRMPIARIPERELAAMERAARERVLAALANLERARSMAATE
jgi:hypothetical protein